MIPVISLRLNNLVLVNSKTAGRVTRIYEDRAQVEYTAISETTGQPYTKRSYIDCQWLEGIPLTDEHFRGVAITYEQPGGGDSLMVKWSYKGRAEISMCGIPITVIEFLHEWQNVYYMLFGNELEVKP